MKWIRLCSEETKQCNEETCPVDCVSALFCCRWHQDVNIRLSWCFHIMLLMLLMLTAVADVHCEESSQTGLTGTSARRPAVPWLHQSAVQHITGRSPGTSWNILAILESNVPMSH